MRSRIRVFATLALLFALAAPVAAGTVAQEIDYGLAVFEKDPPEVPKPGDFDALFALLDQYRTFPVHAHLLTAFIGSSTTGSRDIEEVRRDVRKLVELVLIRYNPEDMLAVFDRAFVSMHLAAYNYPEFPGRVMALTALADFTNLLSTNPLNPWIHLYYTIIYATVRDQNVNDFKRFDPLDELKKALSFEYKNAWFHYLVGQTFLAVSQDSPEVHQLASAEFAAAIQLDPQNEKLQETIQAIYLKLLAGYDGKKARKPFWLEEAVYARILKKEPDNAAAANNLGFLYARSGENMTRAIELTKQALDAEPDNPAYLDSHGFALARAGDVRAGLEKLLRAYAQNRDDPDTNEHLADLYLATNDNEKALPYLKWLLDKDPKNELLNNNLAYTLSELNRDLDGALKMVNQALEFAPDNPVYLDTKGWIYFKTGMTGQALKLIESAIAKDPTIGALYLHRGDIRFATGEAGPALEDYSRGFRLEPDLPGALDHLARLALIADLQGRLKAAGKEDAYAEAIRSPFDYACYSQAVELLSDRLLGNPAPAQGEKPGKADPGGANEKPDNTGKKK